MQTSRRVFAPRKERGVITVREVGVALVVALLFIVVVTYGDPDFRPNLKLKNCLAHMGVIHQAATLALMENPDIEKLTPALLVERTLIPRLPVCPSAADHAPGEMEYVIVDRPGQPLDVECVHRTRKELGHGSFLRLKEKYLDPPPGKP